MRIVYVYPLLVDRAGTERVLVDKMNYLAEQEGYEICLLTYQQGSHSLVYPLSPKVKHVDLDVRLYSLYRFNRFVRVYKEILLKRKLKRLFNHFMVEYQPDIVIASTYFSTVISLIAHCPIKTVRLLESHIDKRYILNHSLTAHRYFFNWIRMNLEMKDIERCAPKFDVLIALTKEDAEDWSKYVKTHVINNVVHLRKDGVYSSCENKRVIFAGRFVEQKGIPDLLRVWNIVSQRHPDWHLDLYGDGPLHHQVKVESEVMSANVHVYPSDENIMDRYCEHSIFVLPSVFEPFGLVIVEAMSCGLPVVAFDCPYGPANIITEGKDGFLIPNRDIQDFADKLCLLIEDKSLRMKMGEEGINTSKRYSSEHIMPQWVVLFNQLVNEKGVCH